MPKSAWIALPLLAVVAIAGCSSPPPPPSAPPPAPPPALAPPPPPPAPVATSDQQFINMALGMGAREIGMGRLAQGKAAAKPVKALATRIVADQTHVDGRLRALAKHLKLIPSPPPDQPPPDLIAASGPDFDKQYLRALISGHQDAISLFESETTSAQDLHAKQLARTMLPLLRHHMHEAQALGKKLGI